MKKRVHTKKKQHRGFTLIELLIVIGILGVLAAAILVALNPLEQFARGRDSGRITTVNQLGHSIQGYHASQNSVYPVQSAAWMTTLQTAAELKALPTNPTSGGYTSGCYTANVAQNGICYRTNGVDAIVYVQSEANANDVKATCTAAQITWIVWSSADGKAGLTCTAANTDPAVGIIGLR